MDGEHTQGVMIHAYCPLLNSSKSRLLFQAAVRFLKHHSKLIVSYPVPGDFQDDIIHTNISSIADVGLTATSTPAQHRPYPRSVP